MKKSNNGWENQPRAGNGQFGSKKISIAAPSTTNSKEKGVASAQCLHRNNISFLDNQQEFNDVKEKISQLKECLRNTELTPKKYLEKLKQCFNADDISRSSYAVKTFENEVGKLRISDHKAVVKNSQRQKTKNTSIVIQLNKQRGRRKDARIIEYIYSPENFSKETQNDILQGITDWIETGEFTGTNYEMKKSFTNAKQLKTSYAKRVNELYKDLLKRL